MKTEIEHLINRLVLNKANGTGFNEKIFVGDILERAQFAEGQFMIKGDTLRRWHQLEEFIELWNVCGISKSIQNIFAEAEWIEDYEECEDHGGQCHCEDIDTSYPRNDCIREFFIFLLQLDL